MAITNHRQVRSGVGEVIVTEWSNAGLVIYLHFQRVIPLFTLKKVKKFLFVVELKPEGKYFNC